MRKATMVAAGTLVLPLVFSLPAMAQGHIMERAQDEGMRQAREAQNGGQNQLGQDQIKQVQQALGQKGFNAGRADGIIGRETRAALGKFQRQHKLQQTGQPDEQTLQALGINRNASTRGASTTGQGPPDQNQNPKPNQPPGNTGNASGQK